MTRSRRDTLRWRALRWAALILAALLLGFFALQATWEVALDGEQPTYPMSWWWQPPYDLAFQAELGLRQRVCWARSILPWAVVGAVPLLVWRITTRRGNRRAAKSARG